MVCKKKIVVIGGPTCSGKTDIALNLAETLPFEIVNYDSLCFYKYFDIGTAKPDKHNFLKVRHHLFDIKMPDEEYNAFDFLNDARGVIEDINSRGKISLFVGGTGLYIKALIYGLAPIPEMDGIIRPSFSMDKKSGIKKNILGLLETIGLQGLYDKLKLVDPEYALKISPNDRVRIIRALEVYNYTGNPFSSYLNANPFKESVYDFINFILIPPKDYLKKRIIERTENMIKHGLIDETLRIIDMGYRENLKPLKSIGYKQAVMYLHGVIKSEDELFDEIVKATTRYAKRQITWFKKSKQAVFIDIINLDERSALIKKYLSKFL
jgi:tRNA dimethylallyltransferase